MNNNQYDEDEDMEYIKEEEHEKEYDEEYEAPISMESLGLTWRDFF